MSSIHIKEIREKTYSLSVLFPISCLILRLFCEKDLEVAARNHRGVHDEWLRWWDESQVASVSNKCNFFWAATSNILFSALFWAALLLRPHVPGVLVTASPAQQPALSMSESPLFQRTCLLGSCFVGQRDVTSAISITRSQMFQKETEKDDAFVDMSFQQIYATKYRLHLRTELLSGKVCNNVSHIFCVDTILKVEKKISLLICKDSGLLTLENHCTKLTFKAF